MNDRLRWLACVPLLLVLAGCGFTGNLRMDPGFASFRTPATLRETNREVAVSLGPVPIRLATLISRPIFSDDDERWIPETLSTIRGVRVYIYDVKDDTGHVARHLEKTRAELVRDGWHPVAAVREDGGLVAALVRHTHGDPDLVRGLVVMFHEDDELVLVNVMGRIPPESLSTVMEGLDIEVPDIHIGTT